MFLSEVGEILAYDWPIYMILKALRLKWMPNDVLYNVLINLLLQNGIGKNVFIVNEFMGVAGACAISSQLIKQAE